MANSSEEHTTSTEDCLLHHMDISIPETENRTTSALNIRECYTVYLIETRITDNGWELIEHGLGQIWRRYSEFEQLRHYVVQNYPWAVVPPLPEKKHSFPVLPTPRDTFDPDFVDRRRIGLENFLHRIAQHPTISRDPMFLVFLQQEDGWKHTMKEAWSYVHLAEEKIKVLNAVVRLKESDPDFEQIRRYCSGIQSALQGMLRYRSKVAYKVYKIKKWHSDFGKVFSEWSAIEKNMGDGLQRAGHFFDSISSGVDAYLEEEEHIVEQIKEYLMFASSLEDVCSKRDRIQFKIEKQFEIIRTISDEKTRITQGKTSLFSKLMGASGDIVDMERRLSIIDAKIEAADQKIQDMQTAITDFKRRALADIKEFQFKKDKELKDTLEAYINYQIKMTKKSLQAWSNVKSAINSIECI